VRVTILGGGGFRVPLICRELALSGLAVDEVVLFDVAPERLGVIAGVLAGDHLPLRTTTDLDTALRGAGLIFAALRVGGLDGRVRDERAALDLGVLGQETVGAGGLACAARAVPVVDAIARRIAELASQAWVISMTNPAGIVTEVMAATLGNRVIGVCDSPMALVRRACAAAGVDPGTSLARLADLVEADYLGLNHLGWLRGLRVGGTDLLPALLADPARLLTMEEGRLFGADLLQALGAIPNEYLYWYYARAEALRDVMAADRTRGEHVRARQQTFYAAAAAAPDQAARLWAAANEERNRSYFAELRSGERDAADVAAGGYESIAIGLAAALTGGDSRGGPARLIVNVPNGTTIPALGPDAVIETVCLVDSRGAAPLPVSPPSDHELGLMCMVKSCERAIVTAALTGSPAAALRAFALHPLVASLGAARALAAAAGLEADDHLAGVVAAEQVDEGGRGLVQAVDDGLGVEELALAQPAADVGDHGGRPVLVVGDDEAAQGEALADDQREVVRPGGQLGGVVVGDRPAHGDAAVGVEYRQRGFQVVAADVVEVDVDALGRGLAELAEDGGGLVVEGGVEADLAQPADLFIAAGAADHPGGALELGDLAGHAAHRAGRAGDEHYVARLQRGDVEQADVGRQRGHAEHPQVSRRRQPRSAGYVGELLRVPGGQDRLVPPAQIVQDQVTLGQVGRSALDDRPDRAALQRLPQLERRDVGLGVVHPAAHVGVH
jgi:6-phospho-beta-glucosidase